jgi:DNA relaxase NicK
MITVQCLCCDHVQPINEIDGYQVCDSCGEVFPVPMSAIEAQATMDEPPVSVIRGVVNPAPKVNITASVENRSKSPVFVDYLAFTLPAGSIRGYGDSRLAMVGKLLMEALPEVTFDIRNKGIFGYTHSATIHISGEQVGMIATGGNSGTVYVQLSGSATAWIEPVAWANWLDASKARLSRVDLAHDDFNGTRTVDAVRDAYLAGQFRNRGQNPSSSAVGPWDDPTQWSKGRTYYIGKRENGKMLRAYEKGRQLGREDSPWVRFEVEFRRQKDKPLSTNLLRQMTQYFAGAYEWLQWIASVVPAKLDRVREEIKISYESLVGYARTAYGKLINVMDTVCASAEEVVTLLKSDGVPRRLLAGTLPAS